MRVVFILGVLFTVSACQVGIGSISGVSNIASTANDLGSKLTETQTAIGPGSTGPQTGIGPGSTGPQTTQQVLSFFQTLSQTMDPTPPVITRVQFNNTQNMIPPGNTGTLTPRRFILVAKLNSGKEKDLFSALIEPGGEYRYSESDLKQISTELAQLIDDSVERFVFRFFAQTQFQVGEQSLFEVEPQFDYEDKAKNNHFDPDEDYDDQKSYFFDLDISDEHEPFFFEKEDSEENGEEEEDD